MKRVIRKKQILLLVSTSVLILLSSLLLKVGISTLGKVGIGSSQNIPEEKAVNNVSKHNVELNDNEKYEVNSVRDNKSLRERLMESIKETNSTKVTKVDLIESEKYYQSVKDKINIQKEEANDIFTYNIKKLFGDSVNLSDSNMVLDYNNEWGIQIDNKKDKKNYWGIINAMNGEIVIMSKIDYAELDKPEDGSVITRIDSDLKEDEFNLYANEAKKVINEKNILSSENAKIQQVTLRDSSYMGLRPVVEVSIEMDNGKIIEVTFYKDTNELAIIDIYKK